MSLSLKFSSCFVKDKSSISRSTCEQLYKHNTMLPNLVHVLLVTACMIFVLTAFVPSEVGKVFAQAQQDDQKGDSDEKSGIQSSADATTITPSKDKVTIDLTSVEFAPLTNSENNQLLILVDYKTNDHSLINSPMAGAMKVYDSDGILIRTSHIPKGFVLGQSGPMQFATSFTDNTIKDVKTEVYMTDTLGTKVSNTLTADAHLTR